MMTNDARKMWTRFIVVVAVTVISACQAMAATVATVQYATHATLKKSQTNTTIPLVKRSSLNAGDLVRTGAKGEARLLLVDGSQFHLGHNASVQLTNKTAVKGGRQSFLRALAGQIYARLAPNSAVRTRTAVAGVRGTYIRLDIDGADGTTVLTVLEGSVDFSTDLGDVVVEESQQSTAAPGKAPTNPIHVTPPILIRGSGLASDPTANGMGSGAAAGQIASSGFGHQSQVPNGNSSNGNGGTAVIPGGDYGDGDYGDGDYGDGDYGNGDTVVIPNSGNNCAGVAAAACDGAAMIAGVPGGGAYGMGRMDVVAAARALNAGVSPIKAKAMVLAVFGAGGDASARYSFNYQSYTLGGRISDHLVLSGGITSLHVRGQGAANNFTKTGITLGAQYQINPSSRNVRYAVGAGYDRALLKNFRFYGVASKPFHERVGRAPIMGHLGIRYDQFNLADVGGSRSSLVSAFAGIEYPLTRSGHLALTGDIQFKSNNSNGARVPFSIGARYALAGNGLDFSAGYQRQGSSNNHGFYAGATYSFH